MVDVGCWCVVLVDGSWRVERSWKHGWLLLWWLVCPWLVRICVPAWLVIIRAIIIIHAYIWWYVASLACRVKECVAGPKQSKHSIAATTMYVCELACRWRVISDWNRVMFDVICPLRRGRRHKNSTSPWQEGIASRRRPLLLESFVLSQDRRLWSFPTQPWREKREESKRASKAPLEGGEKRQHVWIDFSACRRQKETRIGAMESSQQRGSF